MKSNPPLSATSVEIARRLLERGAGPANGGEPQIVGAALQRTCVRLSERLSDSMGDDGRNALIARALAQTEASHPALKDILRHDERGICLDGVAASIETHGVAQVRASIEALFAALVDVLGRLIGEDMAERILDQEAARPPAGGREQAP